jgi:phosphopantetheinyl transferase (holo-ACP synthase)
MTDRSCFSEEKLNPLIREVHDPDILLDRGDGADEITDNHHDHEIGLDVMEYKLPRNEKTVDEFRSLLDEHLSPREKMLIEQRRTGSHPKHLKEASVLDGLLQFWTFKEAIIKALGCGLRMDLSTISLSDLISHPEIYLNTADSGAAATGQKGFTMPNRSSQLVVSFDGGEDPHCKFWSAVFPGPAQPLMLSQSKYILAAAVKFFSPKSFSSEIPLIHSVTFKTVLELLSPC